MTSREQRASRILITLRPPVSFLFFFFNDPATPEFSPLPLHAALPILIFPPFDVGWLAWIALTPLVLAIHGRPMRQVFGLGYLAGGLAFAGILAWIRVFGLLPWVLLAAYLALYPAAFAVVTRWAVGGRQP